MKREKIQYSGCAAMEQILKTFWRKPDPEIK
jgi:hypothetical protein